MKEGMFGAIKRAHVRTVKRIAISFFVPLFVVVFFDCMFDIHRAPPGSFLVKQRTVTGVTDIITHNGWVSGTPCQDFTRVDYEWRTWLDSDTLYQKGTKPRTADGREVEFNGYVHFRIFDPSVYWRKYGRFHSQYDAYKRLIYKPMKRAAMNAVAKVNSGMNMFESKDLVERRLLEAFAATGTKSMSTEGNPKIIKIPTGSPVNDYGMEVVRVDIDFMSMDDPPEEKRAKAQHEMINEMSGAIKALAKSMEKMSVKGPETSRWVYVLLMLIVVGVGCLGGLMWHVLNKKG